MIKLREAMTDEVVLAKSGAIIDRLTVSNDYRRARVIGTYVSVGNEAQTNELIRRAWRDGKRIVVPICQKEGKQLLFSELRSFAELGRGAYGLREPLVAFQRIVDPAIIELLCVPGLAFDPCGHRVGHGAGYYDRFFAKNKSIALTISLIYDDQMIESFTAMPHDIPVRHIVTERRWIDCMPAMAQSHPSNRPSDHDAAHRNDSNSE